MKSLDAFDAGYRAALAAASAAAKAGNLRQFLRDPAPPPPPSIDDFDGWGEGAPGLCGVPPT